MVVVTGSASGGGCIIAFCGSLILRWPKCSRWCGEEEGVVKKMEWRSPEGRRMEWRSPVKKPEGSNFAGRDEEWGET